MLSVNLIERHFRSRRYEQLLEGVAANGLELPLPLRIRLSQSPVGAVGLGLRRVLDMTYGLTELSRNMIALLLDEQDDDGSFGRDPLMTAVAVAGLGHLQSLPVPEDDERVEQSRCRALDALARMQDGDGLFPYRDDRSDQDRALVAAFILFLLGGDESFRGSVRFGDVLDWFDRHADRLDRDTTRLWEMARSESPAFDAALAA